MNLRCTVIALLLCIGALPLIGQTGTGGVWKHSLYNGGTDSNSIFSDVYRTGVHGDECTIFLYRNGKGVFVHVDDYEYFQTHPFGEGITGGHQLLSESIEITLGEDGKPRIVIKRWKSPSPISDAHWDAMAIKYDPFVETYKKFAGQLPPEVRKAFFGYYDLGTPIRENRPSR